MFSGNVNHGKLLLVTNEMWWNGFDPKKFGRARWWGHPMGAVKARPCDPWRHRQPPPHTLRLPQSATSHPPSSPTLLCHSPCDVGSCLHACALFVHVQEAPASACRHLHGNQRPHVWLAKTVFTGTPSWRNPRHVTRVLSSPYLAWAVLLPGETDSDRRALLVNDALFPKRGVLWRLTLWQQI